MNRRAFLATGGIALSAPLVGCLQNDTGGKDNETSTDRNSTKTDDTGTEETSDSAEDIMVMVENPTSEEQTLTLTITQDSSSILEDDLSVDSDDRQETETGIDEQGEYELIVDVEGGDETSYPFSIEEYDVRMGSNLIVIIRDSDIEIMQEQ